MSDLLRTNVYDGLTVTGYIINYLNKEDFNKKNEAGVLLGGGIELYTEKKEYESGYKLFYEPSSDDEKKDEYNGTWTLKKDDEIINITTETIIRWKSVVYTYTGEDSNKWSGSFGSAGNGTNAESIIFTNDLIFNKPFGKYSNSYTDKGDSEFNKYNDNTKKGLWESMSNNQRYKLHVSSTSYKDEKPWTLSDLLSNAFSDYVSSVGTVTQPSYTFSINHTADRRTRFRNS